MEEVEGREKVSGNVEVVSHLREIVRGTEKAMQKAARMVGGTVERHAKESCPVDTGLLRNSITFAIGGEAPEILSYQSNDRDKNGKPIEVKKGHYEGTAPADDDDQVTVYAGTNVEYAPYMELGTKDLDARPFLRPAMENFRGEIEQILEKCMKEIR